MKRVYPWVLLIVLSALIMRFPFVGVGILVLAGVGAIAHRLGQQYDPRPSKPQEYTPEVKVGPARTAQAMTLGQWEIGNDGNFEGGAIRSHAEWGDCRLRVGYQQDIPFILLQTPPHQETEMVFVLRRRQSSLDLAPLVTNTPIESSPIEYRLKTMQLPGKIGEIFEGATNRPRLFRELLEFGLSDNVSAHMFDERYRLEDLTYNGRELALTIYPAADPSLTPYVTDCQDLAEPIARTLAHFLESTPIPSAQQ